MRKGELTRQFILETAMELATRVGLEGLTIGELAELLGMSKSGLFAHFRSKEALQLAVLDHAAERFVEVVIKPTLQAPRGQRRLEALFRHWLGWFERETRSGGCFFTAASFELDDREGPVRERLVELQRDFVELMVTVIKTGIEKGDFRSDLDAEQLAHDLYGVLLVTQYYSRLLRDPKSTSRAQRSFEVLLAGARAPEPRRS